jgi:hypothetical protein
LINKTMGSTLYVCQDLNELNMKMLFTMQWIVAGSGTRYSMGMNIISAFWKHLHRLSYVLNALFMLIA